MSVAGRLKERIFWNIWLTPVWLVMLFLVGGMEGHGIRGWPPAVALVGALAFKIAGALLANAVVWIGKYPKGLVPYSIPKAIWVFSYALATVVVSVGFGLGLGEIPSGIVVAPLVVVLGEILEDLWERFARVSPIQDP